MYSSFSHTYKDSDFSVFRLYSGDEVDENDVDWVKMSEKFPKYVYTCKYVLFCISHALVTPNIFILPLNSCPSNEWLRLRWYTLKKAAPNFSDSDFEGTMFFSNTIFISNTMTCREISD